MIRVSIAICRSVKICDIGEHLRSVSDPRSGSQEGRIDVDALIHAPSLQPRPVSRLHPYAAVARAVAPVSPVPESGRRPVGDVPLSPRGEPLLGSRLPAPLQRPHRSPAPPAPAVAAARDAGDVSPLALVCGAAYGPRAGRPGSDQVARGLVAPEGRRLLRHRSSVGGHGGGG